MNVNCFSLFCFLMCLGKLSFISIFCQGGMEKGEVRVSIKLFSQGGMKMLSCSKNVCQLSKSKETFVSFLEYSFIHYLFLSMTIWKKKKVFLKMRRLNRKKTLSLVKELDAFPKVPDSYVETSASGGTGEYQFQLRLFHWVQLLREPVNNMQKCSHEEGLINKLHSNFMTGLSSCHTVCPNFIVMYFFFGI